MGGNLAYAGIERTARILSLYAKFLNLLIEGCRLDPVVEPGFLICLFEKPGQWIGRVPPHEA